ncbi:endonuclease/exonuclease/phosphatase family protein [Umezawaea beigongshangensis]|uniref:endonuclease/exonuclease/phosphatase family protein n=1 Tax=Umezawaea beigongshangensis TaxID=2780383 RepID=UPI0018F1474B|nr:endonuclease/exonuclease/phosphatase family protein [Umezawaea beigongshangensis]
MIAAAPVARVVRAVTPVVCRCVLAGAGATALVRATGLDSGTVLALPVAGLPLAAVATAICLVALVALRARWSVAVAVLLLVVQTGWLAPRFLPDGAEVPADAVRVRVGTLNLHAGRADPAAVVALVREQRLDVLAVQEATAGAVRALGEAGLSRLLPHQELHPEADSSLYSALPLTRAGLLDRPTTWPQTTAEITLGGRAVRLIAVHTLYPVEDPARWAADLAALRPEARPDAVLLGDFNATHDHADARALLAAGLVDAHAELGRGWAPTWPSAVPLVQIDHVLHGSGLAATAVTEHDVPGTDHRAVVAEVALLPRDPL